MEINLRNWINRGFWEALDWVYPPVCAGCSTPGVRLCIDCHAKIGFINRSCCQTCGEPMQTQVERCSECMAKPRHYTAMRNLAFYGDVIRECIHQLKYSNNQGLGPYFTDALAIVVEDAGWRPDLVMPVPLSSVREAERGYNQSASLASPLAARLGVRYHPFGIERIRDTVSQVGLSGDERRRNVAGAFHAVPEIVTDKRVLLIDDVMTTGSTLEACAQALTEAGASAVYCLTLGRYAMRETQPQRTRLQV